MWGGYRAERREHLEEARHGADGEVAEPQGAALGQLRGVSGLGEFSDRQGQRDEDGQLHQWAERGAERVAAVLAVERLQPAQQLAVCRKHPRARWCAVLAVQPFAGWRSKSSVQVAYGRDDKHSEADGVAFGEQG